MDQKKQNGGKREGAGRKPKAEEDKALVRLKKALERTYSSGDDEDNIVSFLTEFFMSKEGKKFFAEHIIGKPKETIDTNIKQSIINWVETKTYDSNQETD